MLTVHAPDTGRSDIIGANAHNAARQRKDCQAKLIRIDALDKLVSEWVASKYDTPEIVYIIISGDNHDAEIKAVNEALMDVMSLFTRR